mmetsp:Transcript_41978/g.164492  ORF Transcript_41978/g.164492 Transcript_41978/m.164492 type:complete len:584 (-) Transcript_41978:1052-2803(-)
MDDNESGPAESSCFEPGQMSLSQLLPTWTEIEKSPDGNSPGPRAGHAMVDYSNRLYLFGGFGEGHAPPDANPEEPAERQPTPSEYYNDVYEFDCARGVWTEIRASGEPSELPEPRRNASMNVYGGSLFIFGGFNSRNQVLGDMWEFKISEREWQRVKWKQSDATGSDRSVPIARAEHSAVVYGNQLIVFGGYDGKKKLNDTYSFNFLMSEWTRLDETEGNVPNRRCKHASVVYGKKMYVLGGFQCVQGANFALTDLHAFDCEERIWSSILMRGQVPGSLQGHKAVVCEDSMYIIGGKLKPKPVEGVDGICSELNQELWQYRFNVNVWSIVPYAGTLPKPRQLHAAVMIPSSENRVSVYVFGGTDRLKSTYYDDLHVLESPRSPVNSLNHGCSLCGDMRKVLNNETFSDIVFIVEGERIFAHKCVLVARSQYFRNMFQSNMKEKNQNEIVIEEISKGIFLALLEYVYTDHLDLHRDMCIDVLKAAEKFGLDGLRSQCEEKLSRAITVENVSALCEIADQIGAPDLRTYCIQYVVQNFLEVLDTPGFQDMMSRLERRSLVREILHRAFRHSVPQQPRKRARESKA